MAAELILCHLPGLGQVGHSPRETGGSARTLDWGPMWSGSLSSCHHLTSPKPDRLIFCHTASWLVHCSWQAGWLAASQTKCQPYLPQAETSCGQVCDDLSHIDQMYYSPSRHLMAKFGTTVSRLPFSQMYPHPHPPHENAGQICIWSDVKSGQLNIMSDVPLN